MGWDIRLWLESAKAYRCLIYTVKWGNSSSYLFCTFWVYKQNKKNPCEIIILLPTFISIWEIIVIALTMTKRTDFIDKSAHVGGPDTKGCDLEYQYHLLPKWGPLVLWIATLGVKTIYMSRLIYEVSSFSHGKRYPNDFSDADNMLGHENDNSRSTQYLLLWFTSPHGPRSSTHFTVIHQTLSLHVYHKTKYKSQF